MSRRWGNLIAATCVVLFCAGVLSAQTSRPSDVPQGKYENESVLQSGSPAASSSATSQPALDIAAPVIDIRRVALALGMVISMILAMRWVGKRYFPSAGVPRSSSAMKLLSRLVIAPKQQLLMIQVGRRIVVVGDGGGQMAPLTEISDPDEASLLLAQLAADKSGSSMKGFGALFNRAEANFEQKIEQAEERPEDEKPEAADPPSAPDPAIEQARGEMDDLADKIRLLSAQFSGK